MVMASGPRSCTRLACHRSSWRWRSPRPWPSCLRIWCRASRPDRPLTCVRSVQPAPGCGKGTESRSMNTLNVAVVGSGPAGPYTAEALIKQGAALDPPRAIGVDVLDRLPTPYGLVRYGVAPDHKSIKSIADYLRGVLEHDGVRFLGGVQLGVDVTRADLLSCYDAVVYATGAMRDRRLGIGGEDLPGSFAATDFVNWYCGHPDMDPDPVALDAESVAVIGVGNVAVDVARILIRSPDELRETDVSQPVLDALLTSKVREVHVIGRRGPAQAKFTTKELRELGELP